MVVKLKEIPANMNIIGAYAPTLEENLDFYHDLDKAMSI